MTSGAESRIDKIMIIIGLSVLYLLAGVCVALLITAASPGLPLVMGILTGFAAALTAGLAHISVYTLQRLSNLEVKFLKNNKAVEQLEDQLHQLDDEVRHAGIAAAGERFDSVLSEVKIMQNLIDQILRGEAKGTMMYGGKTPQLKSNNNIISQVIDIVPPAPQMDDRTVIAAVREAIRTDRIEIFLQPVVSLPQRKVRFYEMFSRIKMEHGGYLTPDRYINIAEAQELVRALDNLQLIRCIQMLRDSERRNSPLRFFCNIASNTLRDTHFMTELVQFLGQNASLAPKLVFELAQADLQQLPNDMLPVLDGLGRLGCRFSMDQVYTLDLPLPALQARKIKTVKIDADLLLEIFRQPGGEMHLRELKVLLDRNGIDLIGSKIENENQLRELLDLNIDFGQGFLFGEPRANWPLN